MRISHIVFKARQAVDSARYRNFRLKDIGPYLEGVRGGRGLEIGGPSDIFRENGLLPVYPVVAELDGCNFCNDTIWEGKLAGDGRYRYGGDKAGRQYVLDAVDLASVKSDCYDFILCSHVLEHVANPLKAMSEMLRVLKGGGALVLVVPNRNNAYDHDRPVTPFAHVLKDFNDNVGEGDLSHLEEIVRLSLDPAAADYERLRRRSLDNLRNRALHHHVFDAGTIRQVVDHFKLELVSLEEAPPYHIIVLARKRL